MFQHRVVGDEDVRWPREHFLAGEEPLFGNPRPAKLLAEEWVAL